MPKVSNPFDRFTPARDEVRQRIIASSAGEVGSGKTYFWLTAPAPIVVFSLDMGTEGVVEEFVKKGKEIYVQEYEWMPTEDTSQEDAIEIRDQLAADFEHAIQHARTVVWDKEGDIWELFRYAEFGAPNDDPRNYPALNQRYRKYVNMPKKFDVNFGLIRGMKDEWASRLNQKTGKKQGVNTGNRTVTGFGELEGLVHITLAHRREDGKFLIDVGKSRGPGGQAIQDTTQGPLVEESAGLTFPEFAQLVFPDSSDSDWE